ncbi:MAG: hypothetical protein JXA25_01675 [Anaerolineales bacterium]|nr:hypothetical protein [Anaerolineales bacterium]
MSLDKRWAIEKTSALLDIIEPLIYRRYINLPPVKLHTLPGEDADPFTVPSEECVDARPGDLCGRMCTSVVLFSTFQEPQVWEAPAVLCLPFGDAGGFSHPEVMVSIDGKSRASPDRHHKEIFPAPDWLDGKMHTLMLHGWTGGVDLLSIVYMPEEAAPAVKDHVSFFTLESPALILETVKPAEDGRCLIVTLYEYQRRGGESKLIRGFPVQQAWCTTILEEDQQELEVDDHKIGFSCQPYVSFSMRIIPG